MPVILTCDVPTSYSNFIKVYNLTIDLFEDEFYFDEIMLENSLTVSRNTFKIV